MKKQPTNRLSNFFWICATFFFALLFVMSVTWSYWARSPHLTAQFACNQTDCSRDASVCDACGLTCKAIGDGRKLCQTPGGPGSPTCGIPGDSCASDADCCSGDSCQNGACNPQGSGSNGGNGSYGMAGGNGAYGGYNGGTGGSNGGVGGMSGGANGGAGTGGANAGYGGTNGTVGGYYGGTNGGNGGPVTPHVSMSCDRNPGYVNGIISADQVVIGTSVPVTYSFVNTGNVTWGGTTNVYGQLLPTYSVQVWTGTMQDNNSTFVREIPVTTSVAPNGRLIGSTTITATKPMSVMFLLKQRQNTFPAQQTSVGMCSKTMTAITPPKYMSACLGITDTNNQPFTIKHGQGTVKVRFHWKNTGTATWHDKRAHFPFGVASYPAGSAPFTTTLVPFDVAPNQTVDIDVNVTAPKSTGTMTISGNMISAEVSSSQVFGVVCGANVKVQ